MKTANTQPDYWRDDYPDYFSKEGWEFEKELTFYELNKKYLVDKKVHTTYNKFKAIALTLLAIIAVFLPKIIHVLTNTHMDLKTVLGVIAMALPIILIISVVIIRGKKLFN